MVDFDSCVFVLCLPTPLTPHNDTTLTPRKDRRRGRKSRLRERGGGDEHMLRTADRKVKGQG